MNVSSNCLEDAIKENPLTREKVSFFVQNNLEVIVFNNIAAKAFLIPKNWYERFYPQGNEDDRLKFIIRMNVKNNLRENYHALLHEIIHAIYGYYEQFSYWYGLSEKSGEIIIDNEALRFLNQNQSFVEQTWQKLIQESRISDKDIYSDNLYIGTELMPNINK